ncbi:MAG: formylglycine-generating enzyme family protein [Deltaproteobacteria bacterium]|jgi:formylglycine-generating enzyme required for sulfatase activity|nr:formylglycine-generating enzyme family protein [Deltaproteobacteria bacterium]
MMPFRTAAAAAALFLMAAPLQAQQSFTNILGMEFVRFEPGNFMMGERPGATVRSDDDERPVHRVALTRPFHIARHEVTQAQWESVMGFNPSHFHGPDLPVEQVSWLDAVEFLARLDAMEGESGRYRLPTEAEWEYAAREGSEGFFSFGDVPSDLVQYGWFLGNSGGTTRSVGSMRPTGRGLFDIHGNVAEWTSDWFSDAYYSSSPFLDPAGPASGSARSVRGCSWTDPDWRCRSAYRGFMAPRDRNYYTGIRVVREPGNLRATRSR